MLFLPAAQGNLLPRQDVEVEVGHDGSPLRVVAQLHTLVLKQKMVAINLLIPKGCDVKALIR